MYAKEYVFPHALTKEWRTDIQKKTQDKLTEMLGVEVDTVMAEYVLVMVSNKKNLAQIAHDLVDFIGEESAEQFVKWLSEVLPTYVPAEAPVAADAENKSSSETTPSIEENASTAATTATSAPSEEPKRVISLRGIASSSQPSTEKKIVSLAGNNRGTVRSLNGSKPEDMSDIMAKRSQRFGVVEKNSPAWKKEQNNQNTRDELTVRGNNGTKRKASTELETSLSNQTQRKGSGGRLSQLLGPPVNVDQAELDARDSLQKKRKTRQGETDRDRNQSQKNRNDQESEDKESNRQNPRRRNNTGDQHQRQEAQPPLPPSEPNDRPNRNERYGRDARGPQFGGFPGGPPGYGGYPPPPYGSPMFYPPPFAPMQPYGMGFSPQHGAPPHFGYSGPQGPSPEIQYAPRGPRPAFQNKKWVNPNVAKKEETSSGDAKADGTPTESGNSTASSSSNQHPVAPPYAPRNPYYSSQMRPRFQNKKWVRPDTKNDEELSTSLPTTPPEAA